MKIFPSMPASVVDQQPPSGVVREGFLACIWQVIEELIHGRPVPSGVTQIALRMITVFGGVTQALL